MSVADTLGVGPELSFEGKAYRPAEVTFEVEGAVERRLQREALEAVEAHRGAMDPAAYESHKAGWRADCASGRYAWESPACQGFALSPRGLRFLAYLQLVKNHREVTEGMVNRWARHPEEGPKLLDAIVEFDFPNVWRAMLANGHRPATPPPSASSGSVPDSPATPGGSPTPTG